MPGIAPQREFYETEQWQCQFCGELERLENWHLWREPFLTVGDCCESLIHQETVLVELLVASAERLIDTLAQDEPGFWPVQHSVDALIAAIAKARGGE